MTYPVQWANWWATAKSRWARRNLGKVLFDGKKLRDLTKPSVRENVIACVLRHPSLMAVIAKECDGFIAQAVASLNKKRTCARSRLRKRAP